LGNAVVRTPNSQRAYAIGASETLVAALPGPVQPRVGSLSPDAIGARKSGAGPLTAAESLVLAVPGHPGEAHERSPDEGIETTGRPIRADQRHRREAEAKR